MRERLPELRKSWEIARETEGSPLRYAYQKALPWTRRNYETFVLDKMGLIGSTIVLAEKNPKGARAILEVAQTACFFRSVQERTRLLESGSQDQKNFLSLGFADVETAIDFEEKILSQALWVISNLNWVKEISTEAIIQIAASYPDLIGMQNSKIYFMHERPRIVAAALPNPEGKSPSELCEALSSFIADEQREAEQFLKKLQHRKTGSKSFLERQASLDKLDQHKTKPAPVINVEAVPKDPTNEKLFSLIKDQYLLRKALTDLSKEKSNFQKIAVIVCIGQLFVSARERIELLRKGSETVVGILSTGSDDATQALLFEKKILLGAIQQMNFLPEITIEKISQSEAMEVIELYNNKTQLDPSSAKNLQRSEGQLPEEFCKRLYLVACDVRKETWELLKPLEATEAKQVRGR